MCPAAARYGARSVTGFPVAASAKEKLRSEVASARAWPDRVTRTPSTTRSREPATSGDDVAAGGPATVMVCRSRMLLIEPWRGDSVGAVVVAGGGKGGG